MQRSTSRLSPDLNRALEDVEVATWKDFYRSATVDDMASCGVDFTTIGSATVLAAARLDILAFNRVLGFGTQRPPTGAVLERIIQHYAALRVPRFFVQVSPTSASTPLVELLHTHGFTHHNNWVKLFRNVSAPPKVSTNLRIRPVSSAFAETFGHLVAAGFEWPASIKPWWSRLVGRPGWQHYAAFDGDKAVATAAMYTTGRNAYLGPAATASDHRGRGAQGALIARRIRDAQSAGCRWLITETAEDGPEQSAPSYRNMRRFGFEVAYLRPNYIRLLDDHAPNGT